MRLTSRNYAELSWRGYDTPGMDYVVDDAGQTTVDGVRYTVLGHRDNRVTGYSGTIFQSVESGEIVVVHRGTEADKWPIDALQDLATDTSMVIARTNAQARDAVELVRWAQTLAEVQAATTRDPTPEVTTTGHSLGGTLAQICAHRFGLRGETFNAYGAAGLDHGVPRGGGAVLNHVMAADVVSAVAPHYGQVRVYATQDEVRMLAGVLARYDNDHGRFDERSPALAALRGLGSHGIHHFTGHDADGRPDRSVLDDPQSRLRAEYHAPMIQGYRGDLRVAHAALRMGTGALGLDDSLRGLQYAADHARALPDRLAQGVLDATLGLSRRLDRGIVGVGDAARGIADYAMSRQSSVSGLVWERQSGGAATLDAGTIDHSARQFLADGAPALGAPRATMLRPFSDPSHTHHALYEDLRRRLPDLSEERLSQITAQCHQRRYPPGWKGTVERNERAIFISRDWPPGTHLCVDLLVAAPPLQETLQAVSELDAQRAQQRMQNQHRQWETQRGPSL